MIFKITHYLVNLNRQMWCLAYLGMPKRSRLLDPIIDESWQQELKDLKIQVCFKKFMSKQNLSRHPVFQKIEIQELNAPKWMERGWSSFLSGSCRGPYLSTASSTKCPAPAHAGPSLSTHKQCGGTLLAGRKTLATCNQPSPQVRPAPNLVGRGEDSDHLVAKPELPWDWTACHEGLALISNVFRDCPAIPGAGRGLVPRSSLFLMQWPLNGSCMWPP